MAPFPSVNRLVFVLVPTQQAEALMQTLNQAHYYFTRINNRSDFFGEDMACLMIGLHSQRVSALFGLIAESCQPFPQHLPVQFNPPVGAAQLPVLGTQVGSAQVYLLEVDQFIQF